MDECAAFLRRGGKPTIGSVRSAGKIARRVYALAREAVDVEGTLFAREPATRVSERHDDTSGTGRTATATI